MQTEMEKPSPELLLFDLGGVLIEWDGIEPLLKLTGNRLTADQARRFWLESEWVRKFERGGCSPEEFAGGVISELSVDLTQEEFLEAFLSWDRGPMPGAADLVENLYKQIPLACLSNNNALHWNRLHKNHDLQSFFRYRFVSHEIGLVKPDPEIFEFVITNVPFDPGEIVFFDDNPECVEASERAGIRAFRTRGVEELKQVLNRLGFKV
jgi:putative hydrolase of the HAD superfamily